MGTELFYVGTFREKFYTLAFDAEKETLTLLNTTADRRNPDVMAIDPRKKMLYIGNENAKGEGGHMGGVTAFDISDPIHPVYDSWVPSETGGPCYVALMKEGDKQYLVSSGYSDGRLQAFTMNEKGSLMDRCDDILKEGTGPFMPQYYVSKQDHARLHCVVLIPHTDYFACADLGGDKVYVYTIKEGKLCEVSCKKMRSGSGPRHIACASSGKIWYLVDELDNAVSVLTFDPETASIDILQRISALPDAYTEDSWCSSIHLSPDEKYLYVANRGYDSLAIYKIEEEGKKLSLVGWFTEEMSKPREFTFDVTHKYVLIGGMDTNCITVNKYDPLTGKLQYITKLEGLDRPACIISGGMYE